MLKYSAVLIALALLVTAGLPRTAAAAPTKTIRGFADFNLSLTDSDDGNSQFSLGQYDTYITGSLDDRLTYLSEVVFEYDEGWLLDLERLWVRYRVNGALQISAGKFHTALGYWNRNYHHGALLHTSVDRPLFLLFEDEGGILPIHTIGLLLSGSELGGAARISYDLMIGNGLGASSAEDNDERKSITLYVHTLAIDGLDLGASIYMDKISAGAEVEAHVDASGEVVPLSEDVDQTILNFSAAVNKGNVEVLSELALVSNKGSTSGRDERSTGFYALGSYAFGDLIPFAKYDYLKVNNGDPFYAPGRTTAIAVGLKYDLSYLANAKIQYTTKDVKGLDRENLLRFQFAIGF